MTENISYQRGLKKRHLSLIALGGIIGSSFFLGTGFLLNQVGPFAFLAYALGGLITYMTMACLAELTEFSPMPGSFIFFSERYISERVACSIGWSYWFSWLVYIPSECIAAGILVHQFLPEVPIHILSVAFGLIITAFNLVNVKIFGEVAFWLSLIKISLLVGFMIIAIGIFFGFWGTSDSYLGKEYLLDQGGAFPNGSVVLFLNMVILLSNFQGSEIVGFSTAESENPSVNIPKTLKRISYKIIALYLIPTFFLALIYPWSEANLSHSVFAVALEKYGFLKIGKIFSFLIIAGALSCANSGLYATIRSLHALSLRGLAPKGLMKTNKVGVPMRSAILTVIVLWIFLFATFFVQSSNLYTHLLALSGFTGSICWISICVAQLRFRREKAEELKLKIQKNFHVPFFPAFTWIAILLQVFCLLIIVITPDHRMAFYLGSIIILIPFLAFKYLKQKNFEIHE